MQDLPETCSRIEREDELELQLRVATDCPWFEGHFPGQPILPGVVQIGWAAWFAAHWTGQDTPPTVLTRIKFKRPIRPDALLTLRLQLKPGRIVFEFLQHTPEGLACASSGTFSNPEASA